VPLLAYAASAATVRGAQLVQMTWRPPEGQHTTGLGPWATAEVSAVLDRLAAVPDVAPILIGKSLGAHAAGIAAERGIPSVWLTPLLRQEFVLDALRRATAPFLLVGGTADPAWDGEVARKLTAHVLEVAHADHAMLLPGPLAGSARVLGHVATAVEEFLDQVVWPGG
jgi:hypothetical protein